MDNITFKNLFSFLLPVLIIGCAQIHSGNYAMPIENHKNNVSPLNQKVTNNGMIISGEEYTLLSSNYFGVINFTFENNSDEWIRINNIKIYFESDIANQNIKFTSGSDLQVWYKSTERKIMIDEHNESLALGILAGLGAGLMVGSSNSNLQTAGAVTFLGATTSLAINTYNQKLDQIEKSNIFPEDHLLTVPFSIPPGLFVKKWLLLNSKNHQQIGYLKELILEYTIDMNVTGKVKLNFRQGFLKWQGNFSSHANQNLNFYP